MMNEKLEAELVKKYPLLYSQYGGSPAQTCMCWGFECGDGWYKIIDDLSYKLAPYGVVAAQVKEKFGGLRFYLETYPQDKYEEVHTLIDKAETDSFETCEVCGAPGIVRGGGWIQTLCEKCNTKLKDEEV